MEKLQGIVDTLIEQGAVYGPRFILAILVLFIGLSVIKSVTKVISNILVSRNFDETLRPFLTNLVGWTLKVLLIISVASMVGVETTSFVATLGAATLAIGLALQGSLANFAGGVLILIFRPFQKGDYISCQGEEGIVEKIDVFATVIHTLDNRKVIVPNGPLAGGVIDNFTAENNRRVDLSIGIGYNDDIKQACQVLTEMCNKHPKVLKDPAAFVGVEGYGDSSINLTIRPWCKTDDYWDVFFDLNEQIKYTLDEAKISIPFPQRDVHLFQQGPNA
ncbi:MAG: mechanosensitive ion channel [Bdellovibrionales bacterium]|nr:mechanosensitive ion channel [Bdellovibrionales bacterium]NQZ18771.1 mechanosensitive ion channel [Bdellovibrionales bacterium]